MRLLSKLSYLRQAAVSQFKLIEYQREADFDKIEQMMDGEIPEIEMNRTKQFKVMYSASYPQQKKFV